MACPVRYPVRPAFLICFALLCSAACLLSMFASRSLFLRFLVFMLIYLPSLAWFWFWFLVWSGQAGLVCGLARCLALSA